LQSERSKAISLRTYHRPVDSRLEQWSEVVDRVVSHTVKLAKNAGVVLSDDEVMEITGLFRERKALPAGRTLWLGGAELAF